MEASLEEESKQAGMTGGVAHARWTDGKVACCFISCLRSLKFLLCHESIDTAQESPRQQLFVLAFSWDFPRRLDVHLSGEIGTMTGGTNNWHTEMQPSVAYARL